MSCCQKKDCDCGQNSSFLFGLIIGLIIAAIVAVVIYKNNRQDVLIKLKKQIEKLFSSFREKSTKIAKPFVAPYQPKKKKIIKNNKKEVTIPDNLIIADLTPKQSVPRSKKMFKK